MKPDWLLTDSAPQFMRIRRTPEQQVPAQPLLILLIFWVCVLCTVAAETAVFGTLRIFFRAELAADVDLQLAVQLFATAVSAALTVLFCRAADRRPLRTMGLTRKHFLRDYLCGGMLGFIMFAAVAAAAWKYGALERTEIQSAPRPVLTALLIVGWMIQGFSEELSYRGYLMMSLGTHSKPWTAVIVSALCFAAAHLGNQGISIPALFNLTLFGIAMSLVMLRTDSIWAGAALHSVWNWTQGNFFGLYVSGIHTGTSVLYFAPTGTAEWIGGGAFGLEAGVGTTAVLLILITALLLLPGRKK